MKARWKALASVAAAVALVVAPLATLGANAAVIESGKVFVCKYVGTPGDNERLKGGKNPISVSVNAIQGEVEVGSFFEDAHGRSYVLAEDVGQPAPPVSQCPQREDPQESPVTASVAVACDAEDNVDITIVNPNEGEQTVQIGFDTDADGAADVTDTPVIAGSLTVHEGYSFPEDSTVHLVVTWNDTVLLDTPVTVDCEDPTPVAALFDVEPTAASCLEPGTFDTALFPIDREGYTLTVDRPYDGPGDYTVTATAKPGFVIQGSISKVITVDPRITDVEICPLAVIPQPEAPTFLDGCGTETDDFVLPDDTATYTYEVIDNEEAGVVINAVLVDPETDQFADGAVTQWSHTFTDDPCPTPTATPPVPGLAATGGSNPAPWGIGAAALILAGITLVVTRRALRR